MKKIEDIYTLWYKIFSTAYIPQLMDRQKWSSGEGEVAVNDLVYFKVVESPLGATWRIGKIEHCKAGRDGVIRTVCITYSSNRGDFQVVERSVRDVIRLFNIDETSLINQMREVLDLAKERQTADRLANFLAVDVLEPQVDVDWHEDDVDKVDLELVLRVLDNEDSYVV